jgi:hypothetical protein
VGVEPRTPQNLTSIRNLPYGARLDKTTQRGDPSRAHDCLFFEA